MSKFFDKKYASLVPYTPGEQPKERKYIKLNTNESPFPPSPYALRLAREAAGDLMLYSDPECHELRSITAKKFGVDRDEIIFTNGSDEVLNFAFMAFCGENTPAVFPNITYGFYPVFAEVNGIKYKEIPLNDDFSINVDDYINKSATVFIANPNAPTGKVLSLAEVEKIVASNPENIVVIDEAYVDFGGETAIPLIKKYNNLLVTRTFSKSYSLAGGRLGFGIASKEIIKDLNTVRFSTNPYNVNRMTAAAGIGAISDEEYFKDNIAKIIATRERTATALKELGYAVIDSKTNFLFVKHPTLGGEEVYKKLRENGILVRHFDKAEITDYNRITVGSDEEMDSLIFVAKQIAEGEI